MNVKDKITRAIENAISNYDFEDAIADAFDNLDIEDMIESRLSKRIARVDVEPLLADLIESYIDEQLDDLDIEDEVLEALQNTFENL